jgi:D-3-phosphoglycerate dehydrogenase
MRKVLIVKNIHKSGIQLLNRRKDFSYEIVENLEIDFLKNKLKDCEAVSLKTSEFTNELIESAPKLKIISRHGVGYDNIDLVAAKRNKITVSITSNAQSSTVAEHVFFMMLSISRGSDIYDKSVKEGNFSSRRSLPLSKELYNKNILIVGFGRVGKNLIKKCISFEMKILPTLPNPTISIFLLYNSLDKGKLRLLEKFPSFTLLS